MRFRTVCCALALLLGGCSDGGPALEATEANTEALSPREGAVRELRFAVVVTDSLRSILGADATTDVQTWVDAVNAILTPQIAVRLSLVGVCLSTDSGDTLSSRDVTDTAGTPTDPTDDTYGLIDPAANETYLETVCTPALPPSAYDLAMALGTGDGGTVGGPGDGLSASVSAGFLACGATKGALAYGSSSPTRGIDTLEGINETAHVILHGLGADHTFSSNGSLCFERNAATAVEPDEGSTLMAAQRANCTSGGGLSNRSNDIHSVNRAQISAALAAAPSCGTDDPTGNQAPILTVGTFPAIPQDTAFTLDASATDADGDTVFYSWQQIDADETASSVDDALFGARAPTTESARQFPADLISPPDDETLPTGDRTLRFRLLASDERTDGGAFTYEDRTVVVQGAPFRASASNPALWEYPTTTLLWDPGDSAAAPVSCASIDVLVSISGGAFQLVATVPNSGSEAVEPPLLQATAATVRLACSSGIFFDEFQIDIDGDQCNSNMQCSNGDPCDGNEVCMDPSGVSECVAGSDIPDCDDGLFCNGIESCMAGVGCAAGTAPDLDDGITCTVGMCDEDNDEVVQVPSDNLCDDGLFCTGDETCDPTAGDPVTGCVAGTSPILDDGDPCTDQVCNESTDAVDTTPNDSCGNGNDNNTNGNGNSNTNGNGNTNGGEPGGIPDSRSGCAAAPGSLFALLMLRRRRRRRRRRG